MTYLEKFRLEHPEYKENSDTYIAYYTDWCPNGLSFRSDLAGRCPKGLLDCKDCWNRPFPGTEPATELKKEIPEVKQNDTLNAIDKIAEDIRTNCEDIMKLGVDECEARRLVIDIFVNTIKQKAFGKK